MAVTHELSDPSDRPLVKRMKIEPIEVIDLEALDDSIQGAFERKDSQPYSHHNEPQTPPESRSGSPLTKSNRKSWIYVVDSRELR